MRYVLQKMTLLQYFKDRRFFFLVAQFFMRILYTMLRSSYESYGLGLSAYDSPRMVHLPEYCIYAMNMLSKKKSWILASQSEPANIFWTRRCPFPFCLPSRTPNSLPIRFELICHSLLRRVTFS
jgi:hypothetical protein